MKTILGLDLGTNSIGWALVDKENQKILGMGSRIIPMGTDKLDYEKGIGVTKNADRRTARTIRKMGKRYKLRRNKLLYVMHELGICPNQFQFRHKVRNEHGKLTEQYADGFPSAQNIQDLELLPIKKGSLQLDSLQYYQLKVDALTKPVKPKEIGKILYQFNQLRGYAGGNNEEDSKKKKDNKEDDEDNKKKPYEVVTQKVEVLKIAKSDKTFKSKRRENKGAEINKYDVTVLFDNNELQGETELQKLDEKIGQEEELEIRIRRNKRGEITSVVFAPPQKTNWRKQMEATEETLKTNKLFIGELLLKDLQQNKWTKIRNRVILRNRYKEEFDKIWETQYQKNPDFKNIVDNKDSLEKILQYLYPERDRNKTETEQSKNSQKEKLKEQARNLGLKHLIKEQVIYYQRPLKSQTELIGFCKFEKNEKVLPLSHPHFQEFRCWDQINRLYVTSKMEEYNERRKKYIYKYHDRFLTPEQKQEIYTKLQNQKQVGFSDVAKIINLKNDKIEYLNGLNVKAKLKGADTFITIKKMLAEKFQEIFEKDNDIVLKIWNAIFNNTGNEYDEQSPKVSALIKILETLTDKNVAVTLALKLAQNISYPRKYASLSEKAINNILPLMQLNPTDVPETVKQKFNLIETGEFVDGMSMEKLEDYVASFIINNPDALQKGGLMFAFASSLIYGRHTTDNVGATIHNYHDIIYNSDRNLRNSIVEQLSNETMQVIKAIWKQYKINPEELEIRVELARDLKNSAAEREKIYKSQLDNQKINEAVKRRLIELKQEPSQLNIDLYKLWSKQNVEPYPKQSKEPTSDEIQKLRLWEEQKCISPYTLKPIPLSRLFSSERLYDIDHIIPKSRLFDDSMANKIVCETDINEEKGNRTAWEYLTQQNSRFQICSVDNYISHINQIFFGRKKKYLLLEKIPTDFIERQKKDTQYISIAVKNELAKIVGSENIKTSTGEITSFLRSKWGLKKLLMKLTESRFKQMELWDWNKELNRPNNEWITEYYDKEQNKHVYEIKNWSKRYDHRHHSIDALVVALTEQGYIQRLNNLNKELQDWLTKHKEEIKLEPNEGETLLEAFFNLPEEQKEAIQKRIEGFRKFNPPFPDLISQVEACLKAMVVSHKPKDNLTIQLSDKTNKKELKIRSALHEATFYGKHNGQDAKTVNISNLSAKDIAKITDCVLKKEIDAHRKKYDSMKEAFTGEGLKAFNESRFQRKKPNELKPPVYKLKIYYNTKEVKESALQRLYDNNEKLSVKTGSNYLFLVMEKKIKSKNKETKQHEEKVIREFDIVPLYDAVQIAKDELKEGNENYKQKIYEHYLKEHDASKVLFSFQQNDLVYMPENADDPVLRFTNKGDFDNWINVQTNKENFAKRIYKVVKFTGKDCFFIPNNYATTISKPKDLTNEQKTKLKSHYGDKKIPKQELNFEEFGSFGNSAKTEVNENFVREIIFKKDFKDTEPQRIQDYCVKLKTDWLGNIQLYNLKSDYLQEEQNKYLNTVFEPGNTYKKRSLKKFESFEEMENDQLQYFASLSSESLLENHKQLTMAAFGLKDESEMDKPDRKIKFD